MVRNLSTENEMASVEGHGKVEKNPAVVSRNDSYIVTYVYLSSNTTKLLQFLKTLKLEVLIFVYIFAYTIKSVSSMTMIMEKVCHGILEYPDEVCFNLEEKKYKTFKTEVEKVANDYHLYHTLISFLPSVFLSMFIGPWSDKYGRKPPLIIALIGSIFEGIASTMCAYFADSSVKYYLIAPIFSGCTGGFIVVFTVVYSYASDVSTSGSRTFKFALMEMALGLGSPIGGLAGGWIFKFWGYVPVFGCMAIGFVFSLFWVLFVMEETRGQQNKDSTMVKAKRVLSISSMVESFRATAKPRPHKGRIQIWMLLLAMSVCVVVMTTVSIAYLYVYHLFSWSNTKYSTVTAIFSVMGLIAMLISVPLLTKVLKVGDPTLGLIGSISLLAKHLAIGLSAYGEWIYYLGSLLGLVGSLATLAGRARISKIVSKHDLGKVFSFISSAEGVLPIIASVGVTRLFNATVATGNPGLTYFIISGFLTISIAIFIWLACLPSVNYEEMHEENNKISSKEEAESHA